MPDKNFSFSGFGSAAVHAGHQQDPNYAHQTPIYASSTYVFDSAEQGMNRFSGQEEGYIYARWGNPTISEAENKIASLETFGLPIEAKAILHASGMAAITTLFLSTLKAGDKVLTHYSLYGGTDELLDKILPGLGIQVIVADLRKPDQIDHMIKSDPAIKLLYLETPANPTIQVVDIETLTRVAKKNNLLVACDNTFASPYIQQPLKFGVDFIVHSTTKFLNGHGTIIGGVLVGRDISFMESKATKTQRLLGGNSNAFESFLLINGIKTLEIRMERHSANALVVAQYLEQHKAVSRVNYAGLESHPDFAVASKQMRNGGGMLSFELKGGLTAGVEFMNKLKMCLRTVSLGTVDTLLSHPASMTHYGVAKEQREKYGITDGLIRMNVGIETVSDILNDLEQALKS